MNSTAVFHRNLEHIQAEIALLDRCLAVEVYRMRRQHERNSGDVFPGLAIAESQIDDILTGMGKPADSEDQDIAALLAQLHEHREELVDQRVNQTAKVGELRLQNLRHQLELSDFDVGVVLLCLTPELDQRYETLYAYLQDDIAKKRPTVNLALTLLCSSLAEKLQRRESLVAPSALVRYNLVRLVEDPYSRSPSLPSHFLIPNRRVVDYLLGSDRVADMLQAFAQLEHPEISWSEVVLPETNKTQLQDIAANLNKSKGTEAKLALQLIGPPGIGKKMSAKALCASLGQSLLIIDLVGLTGSDQSAEELSAQVFLEARLQDAVVYLDNCQVLAGSEPGTAALKSSLINRISLNPGLTIIAGNAPWSTPVDSHRLNLLTVTLPMPDFPQRKTIWETQLGNLDLSLSNDDLAELVGKFQFSGGQIQRSIASARDLAAWQSITDDGPNLDDLYTAARRQSNHQLEHLAQRITPGYTWPDIVLPSDQREQLREICNCFKNMPLVYGEWGFQSKTSLGKGINILFAGPSGTGKTMAAEIMAGELGLELYKIDLSSIVSKYIGETEKNLDRIFQEANNSNAILFFDEADSLFGKRSEVRDSHDRYANIEISYLLQKMEEYQGLTILTTNFRNNMDDAFLRRLQFAVEFPFPEEEYRLQIWRRVFPSAAPLDPEIDLEFMARQFKVTGGNIKNIAVAAAFLAAEERVPIGMDQLARSTKREYQKLGKLLMENEFGPYFGLVKPLDVGESPDAGRLIKDR